MKNKIKHTIFFLLILAAIAGGSIFIFRTTLLAYFTPTLEQLGDVHVLVKNDTSYISSKLVIKNKSFLEINVDTIKYKVSSYTKTYLQSVKYLGIQLPSYGNDTIDFSLKIPYITILKSLKEERKKGDSASYAINVALQFATVFGKMELPISKSVKLKIPQPPEIKIVKIKWKKVRFKSIKAIATIKVTNYSPIAMVIKEVSYSMTILQKGSITGYNRKPIEIKPKGTTYIDLPIEINFKNIGKTFFQIIVNKDNYNYTLTLNALMESTNPFKESFQVDIVKKGMIELKK